MGVEGGMKWLLVGCREGWYSVINGVKDWLSVGLVPGPVVFQVTWYVETIVVDWLSVDGLGVGWLSVGGGKSWLRNKKRERETSENN